MNINSLRSGGGNNPANEGPSFKEQVKAMWDKVPMFVRFIFISTISLYLISWFTSAVEYLMNIPRYTMFYIQLWRLFTSALVTPNIISIIFGFISWLPDAIRLENTSGSVRYTMNFMINATLINVGYCLVMLLLSIMSSSVLMIPSAGLWPLIMAEISMLSLANPNNQVSMFFIPVQFSAKYYPWALFLFFSLMNMNIQFDILVGVCYGHLFFFYLRDRIQFSDTFITKCENYRFAKFLAKHPSFIAIQAANSNSGFTSYQPNRPATDTRNDNLVVEQKQNPVTTPFKGKGTVLGKK